MPSFSDKFLDDAVQFWQQRVGHSLNSEDARQIAGNLVGFFQLLEEWDEQERGIGGNAEAVRRTGHFTSNSVSDEHGL